MAAWHPLPKKGSVSGSVKVSHASGGIAGVGED